MNEQAIRTAYLAMRPLPGAEEKMWREIDHRLGGKGQEIRIRYGREKIELPKILSAAAVMAVVLLSLLAFLSRPSFRGAETLPAAPPSDAVTESVPFSLREIELIHASVGGEDRIRIQEEGRFLAEAVLPEGMAVDFWEIDGKPVDAEGRRYSLEFDSRGVHRVEAVLREEKTLRCEDACLQFLDENGEPGGTLYDEVSFEHAYTVPTTGERVEDGSLSAYVSPIVPFGKVLDHWEVNGEAVESELPAAGIRLEGWTESLEIRAVLRDADRDQPLGEVLCREREAATAATRVPHNDRPAAGQVQNSPWRETDESREGIPFDPDAPAADGHSHVWQRLDEQCVEADCLHQGMEVFVCSVCGREYHRIAFGEHRYYWACEGAVSYGYHIRICADCRLSDRREPHEWDTSGEYPVCHICGAVYLDPWS